jgi:hypothetical protein
MTTSTITGTITTGVSLDASFTNPVTIAPNASISGADAVYASQNWIIQNYGTVTGDTIDSGIHLNGGGGAVANAPSGSITGGAYGVNITGATGTVVNYGSIGGGNTGIYIGQGTDAVVNNAGTISGGALFGVYLAGTDATLENSGTITGSYAAFLDADTANRLIVDVGALFEGVVKANASAANIIELTSGADTLSGLGGNYVGFQTVTIDSGGTWDVAGSVSGFAGVTVEGFGSHDRLDLTDLVFNGGDTATLTGGNQLVITDPSGNVTIQFDGSVTGDFFHLIDDGNNGTFVEDDETPCFCRGTRIRTPKGETAIEALRIGDLVTVAGGPALPVKWIGRRSYRDWLAIGNLDVQPVLFKAGSLADRVPSRDLLVSPEHAMLLDGMLMPARHLINGITILKLEDMERIDYFHLELERHAVIFAEGAAAESFADDDSRDAFHNADEYRALYPGEPRRRLVEYCAPRVEDGYALDALRRALATRGTRLLPNARAARAPVQQGYLDRATRTVVDGWAIAPDGEPVMVAIVVNGAVVGQTFADGYREDLKRAGIGGGYCSFHFVLPQALSPEVSHRIEVRRVSDWTLLHGGPVTLAPITMRAAA